MAAVMLSRSESLAVESSFHITGYLKKRNTKASSKLLRNWDKRWFALDESRLLYATSAKDKQPKATFSVCDIQDVRLVEGDDEKERRFEFEVIFPGRVLRLRPYSESQRRHWVSHLQRVQASKAASRDSGFSRALESHSEESIPSVVADKIRRTLFRRKKRPSVEEFKAKCEKRFLKSSEDGITSLRESFAEDTSQYPASQARNSGLFARSTPEPIAETQPKQGKWTTDIEQAPKQGSTDHLVEEVSTFEKDWSDDDDMLRPTTPKRKQLAGPRTPSPELAPSTHPRKTPKAHRQPQQSAMIPAMVASPKNAASHLGKPTKLYDNALFQMYDNGDEVQEMTVNDDSDWDASSEDEE